MDPNIERIVAEKGAAERRMVDGNRRPSNKNAKRIRRARKQAANKVFTAPVRTLGIGSSCLRTKACVRA